MDAHFKTGFGWSEITDMIILVTKLFPRKDGSGVQDLLVDHAVDLSTGEEIIVPAESPDKLGGTWNQQLGEWVLP